LVGNILQDVSFQIGADVNTKNTTFAPQKDLIVGGLDFHWNIPGGFLSTAFQMAHEWNQNGIVGRGGELQPDLGNRDRLADSAGLHRPAAAPGRLHERGRPQGP
jgi:hypothetical protein